MSLASDSSETIEVTIIKLDTVAASDMLMHHVVIILTLTFIQGHTKLNDEKNKLMFDYFRNSSSNPLFAVKIVRLKVYVIFSQSR